MIHQADTAIVGIFPDEGLNRGRCCENAMRVSEIARANYLICSRLADSRLGTAVLLRSRQKQADSWSLTMPVACMNA